MSRNEIHRILFIKFLYVLFFITYNYADRCNENVLNKRTKKNKRLFICIKYSEKFYFHGNLNGNLSVIVLNALVAIFIGSKPINNEIKIEE